MVGHCVFPCCADHSARPVVPVLVLLNASRHYSCSEPRSDWSKPPFPNLIFLHRDASMNSDKGKELRTQPPVSNFSDEAVEDSLHK